MAHLQRLLYTSCVQQFNEFIKQADYQPAFNVGIAALGLAVCLILVTSLLHTWHLLGRRTPLYPKNQAVDGWNRRFYASSGGLVIFLLILMWVLNVWSHKVALDR